MDLDGNDKDKDGSQGVQSLEIGLKVAFALGRFPGPVGVTDLAREMGLSRSKTHRYLVSLCRTGLVTQDGRNGKYDLGSGAIQLGLTAQGRIDEFRFADEALDKLLEQTGCSGSAVVWGSHGPTIIQRKESRNAVTVNTRVGSVLPVISSAAGRVFAAFMPSHVVNPFIEADFQSGTRPRHMGEYLDRREFKQLIQQVRAEGFARVSGDLLLGVDAVAAPVFRSDGTVLMTLTVLGSHGAIDIRPNSSTSQALQLACNNFSERVGYKLV